MARAERVLVPFDGSPTAVAPCTHAKSTLLVSSLLALRKHGHFDTYRRHLPDDAAPTILDTPAGVWLPIEVAATHYAACEALELSEDTILSIGRSVHASAQRSVLAISIRIAKETGVTPWLVLKTIPRLWARLYQGGATSITELGPKDARVECVGASLARFAYWRTGLRGIVNGIIGPFATRAYVRESGYDGAKNHLVGYRISWA